MDSASGFFRMKIANNAARMRQLASLCIMIALLILVGTAPVQAATGLKLDGQVRLRTELDDRLVFPSERVREYSYLRTRLALEATMLANTIVYLQLQDSRLIGGKNLVGEQLSGTSNDGKNVDMHQAYFLIKYLWPNGPGFKAGRFALNRGNQRVFSGGDWSNTVRVWEGMHLWYVLTRCQLELMWLKRLELDQPATARNRDFDLILTYVTFTRIQLDLFLLYEHNHDRTFGGPIALPNNALDRYSMGLYFLREFGRMTVDANGVWQSGEAGLSAAPYSKDILAWMYTFEFAYRFAARTKPRIGVAMDVASGESAGDDKIRAYDNMYYSSHRFRGYMDYFASTVPNGLLDLYVRFSLEPSPAWKLALDIHKFNTLHDFAGENRKQIGYEVDATAATTAVKGATVSGGASVFLPNGEEFFGSKDPRFWLYVMVAASFSVSGEI